MISKLLNPLFVVLRFHKLKVLSVFAFAFLFAILLFPKQDLSDWVSNLATNNTGMYMRFDQLGPTLTPMPGISAENVVVEPPGLPAIHVGTLEATPMYGKLITAKLGGDIEATSLFGGDLSVQFAQQAESMRQLNLRASSLNLDQVSNFLRTANILGLKFQGMLGVETDLTIDQSFKTQPKGTSTIQIPAFVFPSQEIVVNFNGAPLPLPLPTVNIGRISATTKIEDGQLEIVNFDVGGAKNDIQGKMRGTVGMNFMSGLGGVSPQVSKIDLRMDITLEKSFVARTPVISTVLSLVSNPQCKQNTDKGTRIACHVVVNPGQMFPEFLPLSEKL